MPFRMTESEAAKCGLLDRWEAAMKRRQEREEKKRRIQKLLDKAITQLLEKARAEEWSQRQLAAKIAIPETTFRRIRDRRVNPLAWLAKIEAALSKLKAS